jgi:hypothetical protein
MNIPTTRIIITLESPVIMMMTMMSINSSHPSTIAHHAILPPPLSLPSLSLSLSVCVCVCVSVCVWGGGVTITIITVNTIKKRINRNCQVQDILEVLQLLLQVLLQVRQLHLARQVGLEVPPPACRGWEACRCSSTCKSC